MVGIYKSMGAFFTLADFLCCGTRRVEEDQHIRRCGLTRSAEEIRDRNVGGTTSGMRKFVYHR